MHSETIKRRLKQLIGWVVALQLAIWVLSTCIFLWINGQNQREIERRQKETYSPLEWTDLQHPLNLPIGTEEKVLRLTLLNSPYGPIYRVLLQSGQERIFHALSGAAYSPLSPHAVLKIARKTYKGSWPGGELSFLVKDPPREYVGPLPVYQLRVRDASGSTFYIDPYEGVVLQKRDIFWRIYEHLRVMQLTNLHILQDYWPLVLLSLALIMVYLAWLRFGHHPMEN